MKNVLLAMALVVVFAGQSFSQEQESMAKVFGGVIAQGTSAKLTVEAIDKDTRDVSLKNEAGEVMVVKCGPEVRNFDQIAVGDTLTLDLKQTVTLMVSDVPVIPNRTDAVDIERAPLGEKPAGTITASMDASGTVLAIDSVARTVTVKGPLQTVVIEADETAVNFDKVKVGDTVNLHVVETLAIAVTK